MIKKHVSFSNDQLDDFGMPTEYRAYFISARKTKPGESANDKSDGIAKVYQLSMQAIPLNPENIIAPDGPENAVALAIERLKELNPGLHMHEYDKQL